MCEMYLSRGVNADARRVELGDGERGEQKLERWSLCRDGKGMMRDCMIFLNITLRHCEEY